MKTFFANRAENDFLNTIYKPLESLFDSKERSVIELLCDVDDQTTYIIRLEKRHEMGLEAYYKYLFFNHVSSGNLNAVKWLILQKNALLEEKDSNKNTPLMLAALHGEKEMVEFFLAQDVNREETNLFGENASQLAEMNGHLDIAELISEAPTLTLSK